MKLLCLGDSITDSHHLFDSPPLGNGYVGILGTLLPDSWQITNLGTDGFTIVRLLERACTHYLKIPADLITVLIGINDIGLMMNTRRTEEQKRSMMQKFFHNYDAFLRILSKKEVPILLMEPFVFPCPAEYLTWLPPAEEMSQGIALLAEKYHYPYLLLQRELNACFHASPPFSLTTDGIHLTSEGHQIIAEKIYDCLQHYISSAAI